MHTHIGDDFFKREALLDEIRTCEGRRCSHIDDIDNRILTPNFLVGVPDAVSTMLMVSMIVMSHVRRPSPG